MVHILQPVANLRNHALALIERDFGKTALYERVLRNIDQIEERVKDEGYGNL